MVQITVPDDLGGDLRLLPEETYEAEISSITVKEASTGNPICYINWVIRSEYPGKKPKGFQSCIGEHVLDQYSLLPQSLWRINNLFKMVTGDKIPAGDYEDEAAFQALLEEALIGFEGRISIMTDDGSGEERSKVDQVAPL